MLRRNNKQAIAWLRELGADGETLAVGHADGAIRLWQLSDGNERVTLNGHKGAVSALRLNREADPSIPKEGSLSSIENLCHIRKEYVDLKKAVEPVVAAPPVDITARVVQQRAVMLQ